MNEGNTGFLTIRISEPLRASLQVTAQEQERSVSSLVRYLIKQETRAQSEGREAVGA